MAKFLLVYLFPLAVLASKECIKDGDKNGVYYRGRQTTTRSGRPCQKWNVNSPNRINVAPRYRNHNYCRNPDNDASGPWCYLADFDSSKEKRNWEPCGIPQCSVANTAPDEKITSETCYKDDGADYRGSQSKTVSGKTCQGWLSDQWKTHTPAQRVQDAIPKNPKPNHNYCRNYDGDNKPWCYTTDRNTKWDYCDLPKCSSPKPKPPTKPVDKCAVPDIRLSDFSVSNVELECGLKCTSTRCNPSNLSQNIVGGSNADLAEWPWQVHLRTSSGRGFCGGSIINRNWILTAAHCVVKNGKLSRQPHQLYIGVGFYKSYGTNSYITAKERSFGRHFIRTKKIIPHECYDETNIHNDIALIELSQPIQYGITPESIANGSNYYKTWSRPICIPTPRLVERIQDDRNDNCWITGWGDTKGVTNPKEDGTEFDHYGMQEGRIPLDMRNDQCEADLDPYYKDLKGDKSQICSISNYGPRIDTCQGDSGGPFVCEKPGSKKFVQIGATSWGYGCAEDTPGVYTRVSHYLGWIVKYTREVQVVDL